MSDPEIAARTGVSDDLDTRVATRARISGHRSRQAMASGTRSHVLRHIDCAARAPGKGQDNVASRLRITIIASRPDASKAGPQGRLSVHRDGD